eukprot:m.86289 g.86289  ORF g.86289 m.86289 type:complete len:460 (+) comp14869_c0_seq2:211-1590(+)
MSNQGRFKDRNPEVRAAGTAKPKGDPASSCLQYDGSSSREAPLGTRRRQVGDPSISNGHVFGRTNAASVSASTLVNPPQSSIHAVQERAAATAALAGQDFTEYGRKHVPGPSVKDTMTQQEDEVDPDLVGRLKAMYKKTHSNYDAGEQKRRDYAGSFDSSKQYGRPTPHLKGGLQAKQALQWDAPDKTAGDKKKRAIPAGMEDAEFGASLSVGDAYNAGQLLHSRTIDSMLGPLQSNPDAIKLVQRLRTKLKQHNFRNFGELAQAFEAADADGSGALDHAELQTMLETFNLPADPRDVVALLDYCDLNRDGVIDYREFVCLIDYTVFDHGTDSVERPDSFQTLQSARFPESQPADRAFGVPSIRHDVPAPRIKRVSDHKNYGDEADARGLVNPNLYAEHGVYASDFLVPRPKAQIRSIFEATGWKMSNEGFEELWERAQEQGPDGEVSVALFKHVADQN